jgi:hypothetical protein
MMIAKHQFDAILGKLIATPPKPVTPMWKLGRFRSQRLRSKRSIA